MTFPEVNATLRTDISFDETRDEEHHLGPSPLRELQIGMVSQIPLDYMHLVCLGVMRKLLMLWMKGPLNTRLGSKVVHAISTTLLSM